MSAVTSLLWFFMFDRLVFFADECFSLKEKDEINVPIFFAEDRVRVFLKVLTF